MYAPPPDELTPVHLVEPIGEIEVVGLVRGFQGQTDRIPVLIRDAAPLGLLVVVSKEDGWLWKESLEIDRALRHGGKITFHFRTDTVNLQGDPIAINGKVVWCEGGQAGVRLDMTSVDPFVRAAFENWVRQLSRNLIFED